MNMEEQAVPGTPEYAEQAEWFLLACLIEMPEMLPSIERDLFYQNECQAVLEAIVELKVNGKEIQWPTVGLKILKEKGPDLFHKISGACDQLPSPQNWTYWLDLLKEFRGARRIAALSVDLGEASRLAGTGLDPNLSVIGTKLKDIMDGSVMRGPRSVADILPGVIDKLEQSYDNPESLYGIRTPFRDLDKLTYGLQPGTLNVIAARPGHGKTAFACNVASFAALSGKAVAFFSLEMPEKEILQRMLASESNVPMTRFYNATAKDRDFSAVTMAGIKLKKSMLHIFTLATDISDIHKEVAGAVSKFGTKLVVVDYLQLVQMRSCHEGHFAKVGQVSNTLKNMAMEFKVPILALAQLSREVEKDKRKPMLSDLRDSGHIEQDADVIGFFHTEQDAKEGEVSLLILKNRCGPIGMVKLRFDKWITRFDSAETTNE